MATLFPSGVSSMPTSSAWSMTRANFPGMTSACDCRSTGTTRIGDIHFVNWVKASWFLLLTNNIRSSAASPSGRNDARASTSHKRSSRP